MILSIRVVSAGECKTLGSIYISLQDIDYKIHLVPDNFPIFSDGLLGWDILEKFKAKKKAENKTLKLPHTIIPFIDNKKIVIPPRTRQVIYALVENTEIKEGFVGL